MMVLRDDGRCLAVDVSAFARQHFKSTFLFIRPSETVHFHFLAVNDRHPEEAGRGEVGGLCTSRLTTCHSGSIEEAGQAAE